MAIYKIEIRDCFCTDYIGDHYCVALEGFAGETNTFCVPTEPVGEEMTGRLEELMADVQEEWAKYAN